MLDVYLQLTQPCGWQREVGSRPLNQYGVVCRAKLDISGVDGRTGMSSRSSHTVDLRDLEKCTPEERYCRLNF